MAQISPEDLLNGYSNGIFPMADSHEGEIYWYSPDPRAIIPIDTYKPSKSLRPTLNQQVFEVSFNKNFEEVMKNCALPRFQCDETWISQDIIDSYHNLHILGFAHSVEVWENNLLVGGLYGVQMNHVFCGESMFATVSNASKVAMVYLCRSFNFSLIDCQVYTSHLESLGAEFISLEDYLVFLNEVRSHPE
jgi:leucyl/phenylalanyl-tRNA--protein transferase